MALTPTIYYRLNNGYEILIPRYFEQEMKYMYGVGFFGRLLKISNLWIIVFLIPSKGFIKINNGIHNIQNSFFRVSVLDGQKYSNGLVEEPLFNADGTTNYLSITLGKIIVEIPSLTAFQGNVFKLPDVRLRFLDGSYDQIIISPQSLTLNESIPGMINVGGYFLPNVEFEGIIRIGTPKGLLPLNYKSGTDVRLTATDPGRPIRIKNNIMTGVERDGIVSTSDNDNEACWFEKTKFRFIKTPFYQFVNLVKSEIYQIANLVKTPFYQFVNYDGFNIYFFVQDHFRIIKGSDNNISWAITAKISASDIFSAYLNKIKQ